MRRKLWLWPVTLVAWVVSNGGVARAGWVPLENRWVGETSGSQTQREPAPEIDKIYDLTFPSWGSIYTIGHLKWDGQNAIGKAILARAGTERGKLSEIASRMTTAARSPDIDWSTVRWSDSRSPSAAPPDFFHVGDMRLPLKLTQSWLGPYLHQLQYRRVPTEAGYDIEWNASVRSDVLADPMTSDDPGVLVVDVQHPQYAFTQAMVWHGLETGVNELVGLIPDLLTRAIVSTALDRLFHFMDLVSASHQNMLLQLLSDPRRLGSLSSAERTASIESLVFAQSSLLTGFEWIWKNPLDDWATLQTQEEGYADDAREWLSENVGDPTDVGVRFAYTTDSDQAHSRWYALGADKVDPQSGPLVLLDMTDPFPSDIVQNRITMEALSTAICFGSTFIPWVGGVLDGLWEDFEEDQENQARVWEARLITTLETESTSDAPEWQAEIKKLQGQILNPLEITPNPGQPAP